MECCGGMPTCAMESDIHVRFNRKKEKDTSTVLGAHRLFLISRTFTPTSPTASSHHSLQLPPFTALVLLGTHLVATYDTCTLKSTFATTTTTCFASIFSFGYSHADTGNFLHDVGNDDSPLAHLPYGETYFHHATGRFSDRRLIVDFIGLPLVPPYMAGTSAQDFRYGANFAVAGATALDNDFFRAKGLNITWTEYSLVVQFNWFKQLLPSLCSTDSGLDQTWGKNFGSTGNLPIWMCLDCDAK